MSGLQTITGRINLNQTNGLLPIGIPQDALTQYFKNHGGRIDYYHVDDALWRITSGKNRIGYLLPIIPKDYYIHGIESDGVLPRKTISMGEAAEKRYYLEVK